MANERFVGLSPLSVVLLKWPGWAALALLMLVACAQSPAPQAAKQDASGWVRIEFTITKTGTVRDAVVVESQPPGVFDQVALRAVRRWQYKPKKVGGVFVEQPKQEAVLTFKPNSP